LTIDDHSGGFPTPFHSIVINRKNIN